MMVAAPVRPTGPSTSSYSTNGGSASTRLNCGRGEEQKSASSGGEPYFLAIGIGINLAHFPPDTEFPATALAALGVPAPPVPSALTQLAGNFAKWYEIWGGQGFSPIRDAWLARAANLGGRIRARLTNEETSGVFEGIDETGALLLRESARRTRTIAAGEVFF